MSNAKKPPLYLFKALVTCTDPDVPDLDIEATGTIDEDAYAHIIALHQLALANDIEVVKPYPCVLVFSARASGDPVEIDSVRFHVEGNQFFFTAQASGLTHSLLKTVPKTLQELERGFTERVVQSVELACGWSIDRTDEQMTVRRPSGTSSQWLTRPSSNGSGMYDLCMALVQQAASEQEHRNQWFALMATGEVVALGEHQDFESADSAASTLGDVIWVLDPATACSWSDVIDGKAALQGIPGSVMKAFNALGALLESASIGHAPDCAGNCQLCHDIESARALTSGAGNSHADATAMPRLVIWGDSLAITDVKANVPLEVVILDSDPDRDDGLPVAIDGEVVHMLHYKTDNERCAPLAVDAVYEHVA